MILNPSLITIILVALSLWLVITNFLVWRANRRYSKLTRGIKKKELRELLETANKQLKEQKKVTENLQQWIEKLEKNQESHVQKIGFIRFNPFSDTGGNQSFCLALLDRHDSGIVISSLHSREQTRIYAKKIKEGKTESSEFSKEEKEALKRATSQAPQ